MTAKQAYENYCKNTGQKSRWKYLAVEQKAAWKGVDWPESYTIIASSQITVPLTWRNRLKFLRAATALSDDAILNFPKHETTLR